MELEGDLQYLWKPKKTLRDWGKTEYKIVRNWTPHNSNKATISTQSSSSTSSASPREETTVNKSVQTSSRGKNYRRSTRSSTRHSIPLATHIESEINEEDLPHVEDNVIVDVEGDFLEDDSAAAENEQQEHNRGSILSSNLPSLSPDVRDHIRKSLLSLEQLRLSKETDRTQPKTIPRLSSETEDYQDLGDENEEIVVDSEDESMAMSVVTQGKGAGMGPSVSDGDERVMEEYGDEKVKEKRGDEGVNDTSGDEEIPVTTSEDETRVEKSKISKRRQTTRKATSSGSHAAKLWQPKHINRSSKDLNELDVCMTVYDRVLRERLSVEGGSEAVQQALANHWKYTRKSALHLIKDVYTIQTLDKRYKKERLKQRRLQKEMSGVLSSLRKTNMQYHSSTLKAREMKKQQEMSSLQEEIDSLTQQLQPILSQSS